MAKNPTPAQIAALKKSKGVKPTAAITKTGQKATGLAKSPVKDRFASTAKTPVKNSKSGFAGSGSSLGTSFGVSKITKGDVAKAVLAAAGGKSAPTVVKAASRAAESTRLAIGTEKMIRRMAKESGYKVSKITSKIKK